MRRREFITLVGGSVAAWPVTARAQQQKRVVGYISPATPTHDSDLFAESTFGVGAAGLDIVRDVALEFGWADDQDDRLPALAAELVRRRVNVIIANGSAATRAAKTATTRIPIVFHTEEDPVKLGLIKSLNTPGGNLTGVTSLAGQLGAKRLELLRELLPDATVFALLVNPTNRVAAEAQTKDVQAAAQVTGTQLHVLHASAERDFDTVFAKLKQLKVAGLIVGPDSLTISRSGEIAALTLKHGVPAIFQFPLFTSEGGLMSYGPDIRYAFRQVGIYAGRILKGEKPNVLPVLQSTKIELVLNLMTERALGITVPPTLRARATRWIDDR